MGTSKGYEFNESQNKTFHSLAKSTRSIAAVTSLVGLVYLFHTFSRVFGVENWGVKSALTLAPPALAALMLLAFGGWFDAAGRAFKKIAVTHGNDINHLMEALGDVSKALGLIYYAFLAILLLMVVSMLFTIGWATAS